MIMTLVYHFVNSSNFVLVDQDKELVLVKNCCQRNVM